MSTTSPPAPRALVGKIVEAPTSGTPGVNSNLVTFIQVIPSFLKFAEVVEQRQVLEVRLAAESERHALETQIFREILNSRDAEAAALRQLVLDVPTEHQGAVLKMLADHLSRPLQLPSSMNATPGLQTGVGADGKDSGGKPLRFQD